ncbi:MAG TPA: FtsX-like permease family protein [Chryseosolibacter sp.]|nr:FtsX-like permease family protein [Chryseosolibacter sp.]
MFRNYLIIALRGFLRNKTYSLINVFGLALAILSAALIFLYVYDELTFDTVHPNSRNLYSLGVTVTEKNGSTVSYGVVPGGWGPSLKKDFAEIQDYTRIMVAGFPHSLRDKDTDKILLNQDGELYWVDNKISEILHFPVLHGNVDKAFEHVNTLAVSESGVRALFGNEDPMNKMISIKHPFTTRGKEVEFVVSAVFKDYPANTFFRPKYLFNMHGLRTTFENDGLKYDDFTESMDFSGGFFMTYLKLQGGADVNAIQKELNRLADNATKSDSAFYASGSRITPIFIPFLDMHFDQQVSWTLGTEAGSRDALFVLVVIAVLILLIAAINYMNLATARSMKRAREVGVRKTMGSRRRELAFQFINESALTTFLAFVVAYLLLALALPYFNQLTAKGFTFYSILDPSFVMFFFVITMFVAVLGGSYPALYLSGFNPAIVLKGKLAGNNSSDKIRKLLVTFQFVSAIILVTCTLVILEQMELIHRSKLNEQGKQVVSIRYGTVAPNAKYDALKNELRKIPGIESVTVGNHLPRHEYFGNMHTDFKFPSVDDKDYQWSMISCDYDFLRTFDIEVISGRNFDPMIPSDSNAVLVNEQAVRMLQRSNESIIGVEVENKFTNTRSRIIGVAKDFPYQSAQHTIEPLVISPRPDDYDRIVYVKIPPGDFPEKIAKIEQTWKEVMSGIGFDYWFIEDEFNRLYKVEKKIASLAVLFACLALCITILGLYGLASYMAEQTTKEIGIRKTLGATDWQVMLLFTGTFLKIFTIALIIALPLGYYVADQWLSNFAYRIELKPPVFLISTFVVLSLMLVTVIYETLKAARANPINALKHE